MKTLRIIPVILLLAVFAACEKAVIDEDSEKDETEETIKKDDNGNTDTPDDNKGDNPNNNSSDTNNQDGDDTPIEDLPVDPNYGDKNDPYEEPDINTDDGENEGGISTGDIVSVNDFLTKDVNGGVYVEGYIVASCVQNIKNADFDAPFKGETALLMADDPNERNTDKVISIQLKSGSEMRKSLNLEDHPENKGKRLKVFGYRNTYLGITGIKDIASGMFWLLD